MKNFKPKILRGLMHFLFIIGSLSLVLVLLSFFIKNGGNTWESEKILLILIGVSILSIFLGALIKNPSESLRFIMYFSFIVSVVSFFSASFLFVTSTTINGIDAIITINPFSVRLAIFLLSVLFGFGSRALIRHFDY